MLAFRDWLRTHDDERDLYLRRSASSPHGDWVYVQDYADAKGEVVEGIIARAMGSGRSGASLTPHVALSAKRSAIPTAASAA